MTELERTLREIGRRLVAEQTQRFRLDTLFPAGTTLSCSACEEGLYRVATAIEVNC